MDDPKLDKAGQCRGEAKRNAAALGPVSMVFFSEKKDTAEGVWLCYRVHYVVPLANPAKDSPEIIAQSSGF